MNSNDQGNFIFRPNHHRLQGNVKSVVPRVNHCRWAIWWLICNGLLSGCMVGPDFQKPKMEMPEEYQSTTPALPSTAAEKKLTRWWEVFDDSVLTSLVNRAVAGNLDLKLAEVRILQARAASGEAVSGIGPTMNAVGSFNRNQSQMVTENVIANQYHAGFDAGWELDFFGGLRRHVEAANADLEASIESRRDVLVSLTAEVARNYINLRSCQQRIAIFRKNLAAQKQSAKLTRRRCQGGFASGLDVASAVAQVAKIAAEIPLLQSSAVRTIHKLGILLGGIPASLMPELSPPSNIPNAPLSMSVGLPSELLRRRPDIRKAEAEIHAQTARIGVATADLYPKFNLTGSIGHLSGSASSLGNASSLLWSFGPAVSWNLFGSGRTMSKIELQKALREQSVIVYRQTVLSALLEVEDALISLGKEKMHRKSLGDAVESSRRAVALATQLYTAGQTDYLNVLQANRSLYTAEDAFVLSSGKISMNLVSLYKALGGGWDIRAGDRSRYRP